MIWSAEKANNWYKSKKWVLGFNFLPTSAVNSTEMWQSESFDREAMEKELAAAAKVGYNSCRVFLQYIVWKNEGDKFIANFDTFLNICKKNGITALPIFFDDCAFSGREPYLGKQDDPKPGVHNSGWTASPGAAIADDSACQGDLQKYVETIVKKYKDDERIYAWDLFNEPGASNRREKSTQLLKDVFTWARNGNPSQPLTTGIWRYVDFDQAVLELSDIVSFHDYTGVNVTRDRIAMLKKHNRPMICTEWLHRPNGNTFESHLPIYKSENIGVYQWGMVNGKTQTNLNWDREQNRDGPPKVWQHDIFTKDFVPYSADEIDFIKKTAGVK